MKNQKYIKASAFLLLLAVPVVSLLAQTDVSHNHPSPIDNIFGDGDTQFVCFSKVHRNFYFAIFFFVAAAAVGFYGRYKLKKKTAEELQRQKELIEEQNRDITDSMRYARRLQEAVLPPHAEVDRLFAENFVFLKPRDIVSGDFYWAAEKNGKRFIVVADCTGHGIPGAFLSIIGHLALDKAVLQEGNESPTAILEVMNAMVKQTLGQGKELEKVADGMEVAVCAWDPASRELCFAGAGRHLLLVQNNVLSEIKGEKCSVGSHQPHITAAPPTHRIALSKGDSFYLSSDGITDQFGGPDGKKLGKKSFLAFINGMLSVSMSEQKTKLEAMMENWKGKSEQTDDMLVIGVRV